MALCASMTKRYPGLVLQNLNFFRHIVQFPLITLTQTMYIETPFIPIQYMIHLFIIYHVPDYSFEQTEPVGEELFDRLLPL
jgi:hypothetical protein